MVKRSLRRLRFDIRTNGRSLITFFFCAAGILILVVGSMLYLHLRPMVVDLAIDEATDKIMLAVNNAVIDIMSESGVDYDDLVTLQKDSSGYITALVTNIVNVNSLQARIMNRIAKEFLDTDITRVKIPIGTLLGGTLFSGKGPQISVDILSISNVLTDFRNEFTSAGINQTRHRIVLDVDVDLAILLTGCGERDCVPTEIVIAETVIVGNVPNTYVGFE